MIPDDGEIERVNFRGVEEQFDFHWHMQFYPLYWRVFQIAKVFLSVSEFRVFTLSISHNSCEPAISIAQLFWVTTPLKPYRIVHL